MVRGTALAMITSVLWLVTPAWAQQSDAAALQRIRTSLQGPQPSVLNERAIPLLGGSPEIRRLGVLTLLAPEARGEIVRVGVPVGELVSRAVRSTGRARYRRAEKRARAEAGQTLSELKARQPKPVP